MKRFRNRENEDPMSIRPRRDCGSPSQEEVSESSTYLQKETFRGLGFGRPITTYANPQAEASKGADPYAIVNNTNPVVDAKYGGSNNFAGNTLPQLLNNTNSKMLNNFDSAELSMIIKYLYMAIDPTDKNQAVNVQFGKAIDEALSRAYAETYITLPFFTATIESSMINVDQAKRTAALTWYQTMLQNIAAIPSKYNMLISLEQHLKDMCYNRNVPALDDLFGQLRKNSFRAKVKACSNILQSEYFDVDWYKQINTLTMVPSRKSNSMSDPLLVINAIHDVPTIKITELGMEQPTIDSENYKIKGKPIENEIASVIALMSPLSVIKWARQYSEGTTSVNPTGYFNAIEKKLTEIKQCLDRFPSDVGIIRVALSVANRAGLNNWVQGVYIDTTKEGNYQPKYNKLCNDVFVCNLATSNSMTLDDTTYRWKFSTLWDKYTGLAKFDQVSGGSFLVFSTREIPTATDYTTSTYLLPKLFDVVDSSVSMVNRLGVSVPITYKTMNKQELADNKIMCRLNPLSANIDIRLPLVTLTGITNLTDIASSVYQFINNVFGIGCVQLSESEFDYACNSDKICFVDVELDDVSNSVISYAQAYAPFKVYAPVKSRLIGFDN